jgi:hypothetical protein
LFGTRISTAGPRYPACAETAPASVRLQHIDVDVRDGENEHGDRAIENIARKQLNAHEEARAVQAMLGDGLSEDGAAQALGWPKARVTARMKLLELPERAQELVGAGVVALSAVDQLRTIGKMSPELLDVLIEFLADGNDWPPNGWRASPAGCSIRRCTRPAATCSSRTSTSSTTARSPGSS